MIWEIPTAIGAIYLLADTFRGWDIYRTANECYKYDNELQITHAGPKTINRNGRQLERQRREIYGRLLDSAVIGPISFVVKWGNMPRKGPYMKI